MVDGIIASWRDTCAICSLRIEPGHAVTRPDADRPWTHVQCAETLLYGSS